MNQITDITDRQDVLVTWYMQKWRVACLSTRRIDYSKAIEAVELAYMALGRPMPQIRFFESPYAVLQQFFGPRLLNQHASYRDSSGSKPHNPLRELLGKPLSRMFERQFEIALFRQLKSQVAPSLWQHLEIGLQVYLGFRLWSHIDDQIIDQLLDLRTTSFRPIVRALRRMRMKSTYPASWTANTALLDYCISVLHCQHDPVLWNVHQLIVQECGWLFPFEHYCLICDRPSHLFYTDDYSSGDVFHAEGQPAIRFHDNFRVYCEDGNRRYEASTR